MLGATRAKARGVTSMVVGSGAWLGILALEVTTKATTRWSRLPSGGNGWRHYRELGA